MNPGNGKEVWVRKNRDGTEHRWDRFDKGSGLYFNPQGTKIPKTGFPKWIS